MQNGNPLYTPIEYLKGVGPSKGDVLRKELGIFTIGDMLQHYPFRYIDRTRFYTIKEISAELPYIQLKGKLLSKGFIGANKGKRLTAVFQDEERKLMELVWFQSTKWVDQSLKIGPEYIVFGKPSFYNGTPNLVHPEMELLSEASKELNTALQPVYSTTEKLKSFFLDSRGIMRLQKAALTEAYNSIVEILPDSLMEQYHFLPRKDAFLQIHFPSDPKLLHRAQGRLKFEELFFLQLKLLKNRHNLLSKFKGNIFTSVGEKVNTFYANLPFELTNAQKKVIKEIRQNTASGIQMNRLLQGDVGSGKTVVALMSMLLAIDNGYQACMMAPTEILANQHFHSVTALLKNMDIEIGLLTGSTKAKERKVLHEKLQNGTLPILIGTHALIEDAVQFANLGLVVIDEQHRFGVEQRAKLWKKNKQPPHILVMTATPIPRTLAMTLYGDLDVSVIDELPPGRKEIQTIHRYESSRLRVVGFMKEEIAKGRQIYIVYPLIQESEKMDYMNLMEGYESITRSFPLPDFRVSIVHGKMKAADKEMEMQRFVKGETNIMVATTVIEVGVNVPNASVMIIESAERFGLSQLHQLRGRVGRGAEQSYCILMTDYKLSTDGKKRLNTMVETSDGFKIAEVDLQLRGPGDLQGTQQSGILDLHLADLAKDQLILQEARAAAQHILATDPDLAGTGMLPLKNYLNASGKGGIQWGRIS